MKKSILLIITAIFLPLIIRGAEAANQERQMMKIKITSGENIIIAILNDTPTAQDLADKLPITLKMNSHQNREYYTDIKLNKSAPIKDNYQIGDIAYWTAGNNMVMFYDKGYTSNLIIMGQITSGLEILSNMGESFTAKIEKVED